MGQPDSPRPGQHPGGQNYPAQNPPPQPGAPRPTKPVERYADGQTQGFDGAYPPPAGGSSEPQRQEYQGGYQLGYPEGQYGPGNAAVPPQAPPPSGPGGSGGGGGDDGKSNRTLLWIAGSLIAIVLVLAIVVVFLVTGSDGKTTSAEPTTLPTTTAPSTTTGGLSLPTGLPTGISIPPIFGGGESTGADARQWKVEVTGTGSAQLVTVGVPDTGLFGSQALPWSKSFTSDAMLVTVTVLGYKGDVECTITRDGKVVSNEKTQSSGSGPLICSAGR